MNLKIGRRVFDVTNEDTVFFNGSVYIVDSIKYFKDFCECSPQMSNTQAKKLIKDGVLKLVSEKLVYTTTEGKEMWYRKYKFNTSRETNK